MANNNEVEPGKTDLETVEKENGGKWRLFNLKNADLLGFQRLLMFDCMLLSYQVRVSERTNTL